MKNLREVISRLALYGTNKCVIYYDDRQIQMQQKFVTYNQMAEGVCRISGHIITAVSGGLCSGQFVGIIASSSNGYDTQLQLIVLILSILECGCAFILIDRDISQDDLINLKAKLNLRVYVIVTATNEENANNGASICIDPIVVALNNVHKNSNRNENYKHTTCKFPDDELLRTGFEIVTIRDSATEVVTCNNDDETGHCDNEYQYAYAVYTSGSTGSPKCIKVPHSCLIPNILQLIDEYGVRADDTIFLSAPLTFDPSILDIFVALYSGASLMTVAGYVKLSASSWQLFRCLFVYGPCKVTILSCTPSLWLRWMSGGFDQMTRQQQSGGICPLRIVALGGEPMPLMRTIVQWNISDKVKLYNLYGVTEVSCWASFVCVNDEMAAASALSVDEISLGTAMNQTVLQVRHMDSGLPICSSDGGGIGQMFIGSFTRICTVEDEDSCHTTNNQMRQCHFRATGDLVEVTRNGKYYFRGRDDGMVKLYGRRVDLSAIENVLQNNSCIARCCCFLYDTSIIVLMIQLKNNMIQYDCQRYILDNLKHTASFQNLKIRPSDMLIVPKLPLNQHGKLSIKLCRDLYRKIGSSMSKSMPLSINVNEQLKHVFCRIWRKYYTNNNRDDKQMLPLQQSFEGDSIMAMQFISELSCSLTGAITTTAATDEGGGHFHLPRNLISYLLSHRTLQQCLELLFCGESSNDDYYQQSSPATDWRQHTMTTAIISTCSAINSGCLIEDRSRGTVNLHTTKTTNSSRNFNRPLADRKHSAVLCKVELCWKVNMEKCVDASPLLLSYDSGKCLIVCGSHSGYLMAVDVLLGNIIWKRVLPDRIESSACTSIDGCYIFVGCYDKKLYCMEVTTGWIKWSFNCDDVIKCTARVDHCNRFVYFGSYDHHLYCIQQRDGVLSWKMNLDNSSIYASVAIMVVESNASNQQQLLVIGTLAGSLVCLNLLADHHPPAVVKFRWNFAKPIFASPLILKNHQACLAVDVSGKLNCYSLSSGNLLWHYQVAGNVFSWPISVTRNIQQQQQDDDILIGCYDKCLYRLSTSRQAATLLWKSIAHTGPIYSTPAVEHRSIIVDDDVTLLSSLVVSVSTDGCLHILNATNGHLITTHRLNGDVFSSPVLYNDRIFVGCRDNHLYCLKLKTSHIFN